MSGILGQFSLSWSFNSRLFSQANNLVRHRGPDDYGYITITNNFQVNSWNDEHLTDLNTSEKIIGAFGFRRLSIIELSNLGYQPMPDISGKYWIIFDGEIYNYIEIRNELIDLGYIFKSRSDTEVILNAYKEWGTSCLNKFNGMWAFAILDLNLKQLFCSRDRLGIKPFYYAFTSKSFIFASEVKQILKILHSNNINQKIIFDYLAGSYGNESAETFFNGILKLTPGNYILIDLSKNSLVKKEYKWWNLPINEQNNLTFSQTIEAFKYLFTDSINLRLRSDVQLGTCLSGGLDSSGMIGIVDKLLNRQHKAFHVRSHSSKQDEIKYVAEIIKNLHVNLIVKETHNIDLSNYLRILVWHHDEPLISGSMLGGYFVYQLVRESGVKVALDGQGADELLGGYQTNIPYLFFIDQLLSLNVRNLIGQVKINSKVYDENLIKIYLLLFLKTLKFKFKSTNPNNYFTKKNLRLKLSPWLNEDFINCNLKRSEHLNFNYRNKNFNSIFKQDSFYQLMHTNLPGILRQVDRNSMANSVEARVPFLDYRLVEFIFKVPSIFIMKDGFTKYFYRESLKGHLPESVRLRREKIGFEMPERDWIMNSNKYIKELFVNSMKHSNVLNYKKINENLNCFLNTGTYDNLIWRVSNVIELMNINNTLSI